MGSKLYLVALCLISLSLLNEINGNTEKPYYRAAVFQYHHIKEGKTSLEVADANANYLIKVSNTAKTYGADIIVFPEIGISTIFGNKSVLLSAATLVPLTPENLCDESKNDNDHEMYQKYLRKIACTAKQNQMYIIINVHEKHPCTGSPECPKDGFQIFNTNVVFDRQGTVISHYRKYNLFDSETVDSSINKPKTPELSTFTTDFNVTFGQFICFDILFQSPALDLVREKGITDIVFPTYWFSELPFLTATQAQLGFAYTSNVNLLAANINYPKTSSTGSGIYAGTNGPLVVNEAMKAGNTLLIANVPKFKEAGKRYEVDIDMVVHEMDKEDIPRTEDTMKWLYDDFDRYSTKAYNPRTFKCFNETICNNGLCCNFVVDSDLDESKTSESYYRYRIAAFSGLRYYGVFTAGIEVCSMLACTNETIQSCGRVIDKKVQLPVTFNNVVITSSVQKDHAHFFPSVLTTDFHILDTNSFSYKVHKGDNERQIELSLTRPRNDLYAFAIYGRDESLDGKPIE